MHCQTEELLNCSNLVLSDTQIPSHVCNLDAEELKDGVEVLFLNATVYMLVFVYKSTMTNLQLSPVLTDVVLRVCVHRLPVSQPGDDRSRVSSHITVEDHSAVDHCSHFLHKLL